MVDPVVSSLAIEQLRDAVRRSREIVIAKKQPDRNDKVETHAAKEAAAKLRAIEEENEDKSSFRSLREKYAGWVYKYLVGYSICCFGLLLAVGGKWWDFALPESVLQVLVGSTAVSAIGLVIAVTHGLFKR